MHTIRCGQTAKIKQRSFCGNFNVLASLGSAVLMTLSRIVNHLSIEFLWYTWNTYWHTGTELNKKGPILFHMKVLIQKKNYKNTIENYLTQNNIYIYFMQ